MLRALHVCQVGSRKDQQRRGLSNTIHCILKSSLHVKSFILSRNPKKTSLISHSLATES